MTDIVERLRVHAGMLKHEYALTSLDCQEAANEIERLERDRAAQDTLAKLQQDRLAELNAEIERLENELKLADEANYKHSEANRLLEQEIERLREALEKIARDDYCEHQDEARAALSQKEPRLTRATTENPFKEGE